MSEQPECEDGDHQFKSVSNNWFHWNTGEVMCIGECVKCGIRKEIEYSKVRKSVVLNSGRYTS